MFNEDVASSNISKVSSLIKSFGKVIEEYSDRKSVV
jgi:hypothetical protein